MPRVKGGPRAHQRHRKIIRLARGYYGRKSKTFRAANEQLLKSMAYAYRDRRARKRDFRRLWITRINAAARVHGMSYNRFISGLRRAGVEINRKMLADLAVNDSQAFDALVERAKTGLA